MTKGQINDNDTNEELETIMDHDNETENTNQIYKTPSIQKIIDNLPEGINMKQANNRNQINYHG